jgi:ribosomal protein S17
MSQNLLPKGARTIETVVVTARYESEHPSFEVYYPAIEEIELLECDGWKEGDKVRITIDRI